MNSIGLYPSVRIRIADNFAGSVELDLETPLVSLVMRALSRRPDLVVSLAKVRAAEDKIKAIKASYFPKDKRACECGLWYGKDESRLQYV